MIGRIGLPPLFRFHGLSFKFALTITAVVAGVAFTIGAVTLTLDWRRLRIELEQNALLMAHSVAITAGEPILRNDSWFLYKSLKRMATQEPRHTDSVQILAGMILDPDGTVLAHLDPAAHPLGLPLAVEDAEEDKLLALAKRARHATILYGPHFVEGVTPIFADNVMLGLVRVRVSDAILYQKAERYGTIILGVTLALVIIGSMLGAVISRRITRPLAAMTEGLDAVSRGELGDITPVPVEDDDELGELARTFNKMAVEMAEKKVLEEQMAVNAKLVALGNITAGVAHEVNNPLAGLLNCIDTMKKHPENRELMDRYLPVLETGLKRIHGIVEGLLVELRMEDSQEDGPPVVLEDLKDILGAEINGRAIDFQWEDHLGGDLRITSRRAQQIVFNLLKNAVQAVGTEGRVTFRSYQDDTCVVLEVEDDGPGIPAENRSQLFDPFFTTKATGTGLGLWIVYRLVESMRGVIEVESQPGHGSRFQVTLPTTEVGARS